MADTLPHTSQPAGLGARSPEADARVVRPESVQKKKVIMLSVGKRSGCTWAHVHKDTAFNSAFNKCLLSACYVLGIVPGTGDAL